LQASLILGPPKRCLLQGGCNFFLLSSIASRFICPAPSFFLRAFLKILVKNLAVSYEMVVMVILPIQKFLGMIFVSLKRKGVWG
jgi:hypothetical protein